MELTKEQERLLKLAKELDRYHPQRRNVIRDLLVELGVLMPYEQKGTF